MRIHILNVCLVAFLVTSCVYGGQPFGECKKIIERGIADYDKRVAFLEDKIHVLHEMEMKRAPKEGIVEFLWAINREATIPPIVMFRVAQPDATTFAREVQELKNALEQRKNRFNSIKTELKNIAAQYGIPGNVWEKARFRTFQTDVIKLKSF